MIPAESTESRMGWSTCAVLTALLVLPQPLAPALIVVDGTCSLVDAITAANTDSPTGGCSAGAGADEVRLTQDVLLMDVDNDTNGYNGLPSVTSDITIEGGDFRIERDLGADGALAFVWPVSPGARPELRYKQRVAGAVNYLSHER